ncbi:hypothetical protein CEXT_468021 [Caerostris extrusa]|uniref:Uncharacterized protein n=1 Tax=Caerostris extrusa TaxID=172846 RepID=A0AAV4XLA0_CAEEX|nr:hypothetical protein CEXT_468021 [Caerostris extrusa]
MTSRLFIYDTHHHILADCHNMVTQKQLSVTHIHKLDHLTVMRPTSPLNIVFLSQRPPDITRTPIKACLTTFLMTIRLFLYDPQHHLQADCHIMVTQKQPYMTHIHKTRPPDCHGRQAPNIVCPSQRPPIL